MVDQLADDQMAQGYRMVLTQYVLNEVGDGRVDLRRSSAAVSGVIAEGGP